MSDTSAQASASNIPPANTAQAANTTPAATDATQQQQNTTPAAAQVGSTSAGQAAGVADPSKASTSAAPPPAQEAATSSLPALPTLKKTGMILGVGGEILREVPTVILSEEDVGHLKLAGFSDAWLAKVEPALAQETKAVVAKHMEESQKTKSDLAKIAAEHNDLKRSHDKMAETAKWAIEGTRNMLGANVSPERLALITDIPSALNASADFLSTMVETNAHFMTQAKSGEFFRNMHGGGKSTTVGSGGVNTAAPAGQQALRVGANFNAQGNSGVTIPEANKRATSDRVEYISMRDGSSKFY